MKYYLKGLLFFVVILFSSCEKVDNYTMDARTNFEALWTIMDEHYCFFEYKDVDWKKVYRKYSPQVTDTIDRYQLFDLLGNMLSELKDGHTNLDIRHHSDCPQLRHLRRQPTLNRAYLRQFS